MSANPEVLGEACTIIAIEDDLGGVLERLKESIRGPISIEGKQAGWKTLTVSVAGQALKLTSRKFQRPGDPFSRMIMGMHNYFNHAVWTDKTRKKSTLEFIAAGELAIAVARITPAQEVETRRRVVLPIASHLKGMVFTVNRLLDARGNLLAFRE